MRGVPFTIDCAKVQKNKKILYIEWHVIEKYVVSLLLIFTVFMF